MPEPVDDSQYPDERSDGTVDDPDDSEAARSSFEREPPLDDDYVPV